MRRWQEGAKNCAPGDRSTVDGQKLKAESLKERTCDGEYTILSKAMKIIRGEIGWPTLSARVGPSGKLVLATLPLRSQQTIKVSGCCVVGAVTAKRKRGSLRCRVSCEFATGSESEEEADSDLDLTAGVGKVAVGVGDAAESRVEGQRRSGCRAADDISGVVDSGDVLVIEEIERLAKDFGAVALTEPNFLGEAKVHIDGSLQLEGIASDDVDTLP